MGCGFGACMGCSCKNKIRFEENLQRWPRFGLRGGNMVMSSTMQDGMNISFNKSLVMNELPSGDALKVRLEIGCLTTLSFPQAEHSATVTSLRSFTTSIVSARFHLKGQHLNRVFSNPHSRIAECPAGIINSIGLQNPGVDAVINNELPRLKRCFFETGDSKCQRIFNL